MPSFLLTSSGPGSRVHGRQAFGGKGFGIATYSKLRQPRVDDSSLSADAQPRELPARLERQARPVRWWQEAWMECNQGPRPGPRGVYIRPEGTLSPSSPIPSPSRPIRTVVFRRTVELPHACIEDQESYDRRNLTGTIIRLSELWFRSTVTLAAVRSLINCFLFGVSTK